MIRKGILLILLSYSVLISDYTSMFDTLNPLKMRAMFFVNTITVSLYQQAGLRQNYHSVYNQLGSNILKHINCMKTLCDQWNEMWDTITDVQLACNLLSSFLLNKYTILIISLMVQSENNLQIDRLNYRLLQSYDRKAIDFTRKDNDANFAKSYVSDCKHWVPGKQVNGLCYICHTSHHFKAIVLSVMTIHVCVVAEMIYIVSRTTISKEVAIEKTIGTVREIRLVRLHVWHLLLLLNILRTLKGSAMMTVCIIDSGAS